MAVCTKRWVGTTLLTLVVLLLGACPKNRPGPDPRSGPGATSGAALLKAAGPRVTVAALVHPGRWRETAATLRSLLGGLDRLRLDRMLAAPDLWTAIGRALPGELARKWPAALPGRDPARPLAVGLLEPVIDDRVLAAQAGIPSSSRDAALTGFRNRVIIPAADAGLLARSLTKLARDLGLVRGDLGVVPDTGGSGRLYAVGAPDKNWLLAVIPHADHVRLELAIGDRWLEDKKTLAAGWAERMARPEPGAMPVSPALMHTLSSPGFVSLHIRPWVMRDLTGMFVTQSIYGALPATDPRRREEIMFVGLAMVARVYLLLSPVDAEMDDVSIGVSADGGLRLHLVGSLTKQGAKVYRAALKGAHPPPKPEAGQHTLKGWVRADTKAMLSAAAAPLSAGSKGGLRQLARTLAQCGVTCAAHLLLRRPVGLAKYMTGMIPGRSPGLDLRSVSVVADVAGTPDEPRVHLAVAGSSPAGEGSSRIEERLTVVAKSLDLVASAAPRFMSERRGAREVFRLGLGMDPVSVFSAADASPPGDVLGELVLQPAALARIATKKSPLLASALRRVKQAAARVRLANRALVVELNVGVSGKPPPAFRAKQPGATALDWASPGLAEARTRGALCLARATRELTGIYAAMQAAPPGQRTKILLTGQRAIQEPLSCAVGQPDTRRLARRVQLALALYGSRMMERAWNEDVQLQILGRACKQKHAEACRLEKRVRSRPRVELARGEADCAGPPRGPISVRRLTSDGALTRDHPVGAGSDVLAVDRGARHVMVQRAMGAVGAKRKEKHTTFALRQADGGLKLLKVGLAPGNPGAHMSGAIMILVEGAVIHVRYSDTERSLPWRRRCKKGESGPCLNTARLAAALEKLQREARQASVQVQASLRSPWSDIAPALATAACAGSEPIMAGMPSQNAVFLGW